MPRSIPQGPLSGRVLIVVLTVVLVLGCRDGTGPGYGAPTSLLLVGGDGQAGVVAGQLPSALRVLVTDEQGRAVPRAGVTFRVLSGGGSLVAPSLTDSLGAASALWTLGTSTADSQRVQVTATAAAAIAPVTFRGTALAGPPAAVARVSGDGQQGEVGQRLAQMLVASVKDAYGNPVPRVEVSWTVVGAGTSISPPVDTSDAAGLSRASWSLGTGVGEYAAHAGVGALPTATFLARSTAGAPARLTVQPDMVELTALGDTLRLQIQAWDRYGNAVTGAGGWRSTDAAVVAVDTAGLLRSVGNGRAAVVVSVGPAADTVQVTVRQLPARVTVTPAAGTLNAIGDTLLVRGLVADRNGREIVGEPLLWSSGDPAVAEIHAGGVVISRSVGRTAIRATSGTLSASVDVLVRQVLASLRLSAGAAGLREGETLPVTAAGADSNGVAMPLPGLAWGSSRADVAAVANGYVTGVRFGATQVSASSGAVSAGLTLYVVAPQGRIGGGYYHTCALDATGRALCWGAGDMGQLGNGSFGPDTNTPQLVSGGRSYVSISVSERFACALTAAGDAYCWGRNWEGQVGDGTVVNRAVPTLVQGGLHFTTLVVGDRHACGLDAAGTAYCWGEGLFGALGHGDASNLSAPTAVLGGLTFRSLVSGLYHVCGIASDGLTYCWGYPYQGATGRGTGTLGIQGTPLPVLGGQRFVQLAAGYMLTCGLTADHSVYCWGSFWYPWGTSPPAMGAPTLHAGRYVALSVGYSHVCGYALDMKFHCWGANDAGELGLGTASANGGEGDVVGGRIFVSAGIGQTHMCAITPTGEAYCWGRGIDGARGDGTNAGSNAPGAPVAGPTPFR